MEHELPEDVWILPIQRYQLYDASNTLIPCNIDGTKCSFVPTVPGRYCLKYFNGTEYTSYKFAVVFNVDSTKIVSYDTFNDRVHTLATPIQPHQANHSYNGIMFDIKAKGPADVEILAFEVGGLLGPTSVYASAGPWKENKDDRDWSMVMARDVNGVRLTTIKLSIPIVVLAQQKRGFYIHCKVLDDEALKYQSYHNYSQVIAQDKNIALFPGQARCGATAFDRYGRWRNIRGFTGKVIYREIRKVWNTRSHYDFPASFQEIVRLLLMMWNRSDCVLNVLPQEALFVIISKMDWDWFEDHEKLINSEESADVGISKFFDYY